MIAFKNALTELVDYCTLSSLQLQLSCIQRVDMTFRLFLIWVVRSHDIMAHQAVGHPQDHTLHVLCARESFWWRMQLRRFLQWRQPRHSQLPPLNLNSKLYQLESRKSEIYIFVIFYSRNSIRSVTA